MAEELMKAEIKKKKKKLKKNWDMADSGVDWKEWEGNGTSTDLMMMINRLLK